MQWAKKKYHVSKNIYLKCKLTQYVIFTWITQYAKKYEFGFVRENASDAHVRSESFADGYLCECCILTEIFRRYITICIFRFSPWLSAFTRRRVNGWNKHLLLFQHLKVTHAMEYAWPFNVMGRRVLCELCMFNNRAIQKMYYNVHFFAFSWPVCFHKAAVKWFK